MNAMTERTEKTIKDLDDLQYHGYSEHELLIQVVVRIMEYLPDNVKEKAWDII